MQLRFLIGGAAILVSGGCFDSAVAVSPDMGSSSAADTAAPMETPTATSSEGEATVAPPDGPEDDGPEDDGPEDDGPEGSGPEDDGPEDDGTDEMDEDDGTKPDAGSTGGACDPLFQDCAEGEGCYGYDDEFVCAAISNPGHAGDGCESVSGCDAGLQCVPGDALADCGGTGCCTPFCDLTEDGPCANPKAKCVPYFEEGAAAPGHDDIGLCIADDSGPFGDGCHPLLQDCAADEGCYLRKDEFGCAAIAERGEAGDACEYLNSCDQGLQCVNADRLDGCNATACCTYFCDSTDDTGFECPFPGRDCIRLYVPGSAPPGFEDVGICAVE